MSVRNDFSRLRKNRLTHFQIALICSLGFALLAFSWTVPRENIVIETFTPIEPNEVEIIPRTKHERPTPPPPPITEKVEILDTKPIETPVEIKPTEKPVEVEQPISSIAIPTPAPKKPVVVVPPPQPKEKDIDDEESIDEEITYDFVDKMPRFPGCEELSSSEEEIKLCATEKLLTYLGKNIKYPGIARENGIQGMVVLKFIINKKGEMSDVEVLRSVGGGCTKEAIRVVKSMPNWIPGEQRGRPVKVMFRLPIKFKLAN